MRLLLILAASLAASLVPVSAADAACLPAGMTRAQLMELRSAKWDVAEPARRQALAMNMLDCLSDSDPVLRDEAGFEALQAWMRAARLDGATMHAIRATLLARLQAPDPSGFSQPFAALVLAEVVRADRIAPFMSDAERSALARAGTAWLAAVRDYRGFDASEGWRHGVAHGADLMLQLAVHPALGKADQQSLLAAIGAQLSAPAAPPAPHFYRYGEGERLMAPVFYLARKSALESADWEAWFASLAPPASTTTTQAALAHRHNLKSFLLPLYVNLAESQDAAQRARVLPFVTKALRQLD